MSETKVLHVTLPADLARLVEAKVASGEYANASEVVASGLEALVFDEDASPHSEAEIERWLREEVLPTIDEIDRDPSRLVPFAEAKRRIEHYMATRHEAFGDA